MRLLLSVLLLVASQRLLGQSTSVRSLDLGSGAIHLGDHPATGGLLLVGRDANTYVPAFIRVDAAGQTVSASMLDAAVSVGITEVARLAGGHYAAIGYGSDASGNKAMVMRLDSSGQPAGDIRFHAQGNSGEWLGIAPTADGGCVVVGNGLDNNFDSYAMVARLDAQLDTVWTRVLPNDIGRLTAKRIAILPSGDLLVVGERASLSNVNYRLCVHRMTAHGALVWSKEYTASAQFRQLVRELHYDGQGRLAIASLVEHPVTAEAHISLCVLDTAGNVIGLDTLGGGISPEIRGIAGGHGGAVVVAGTLTDDNFNQVGFSLAFSSSGGLVWANRFEIGGAGILFDVLPEAGGGYWMTGSDFGLGYLLQTDAQGAVADSCGTGALPMQQGSLGLSAAPITPGLSAGMTVQNYPATSSPLTLVNQLQCLTTARDMRVPEQPAQVYPQPMRTSAHIRLPGFARDPDAQWILYDMAGRLHTAQATRTQNGWLIHRDSLPAGLYSYQVLQGGQRIASGKLWIAD
jgi:hypothetical protein